MASSQENGQVPLKTAARVRFKARFHLAVQASDFPEIHEHHPWCFDLIAEAVHLILARRDDMEPKTGRLLGAYATSFRVSPSEDTAPGRIIYTVARPNIIVYAIHPDHDEAYRRARARCRS